MQKNFEKSVQETEAAFALAVVLLNILILAAAGGLIWLLQTLAAPNSPLNAVVREIALR